MQAMKVVVSGPKGRTRKAPASFVLLCGLGCLVVAGCNGQSTQDAAVERQDKALKDPFGYSPDLKKSDMTVTGNGSFDKEALKRDVDHVVNP